MDINIEFLNYIYQNTKMGMDSTEEVKRNIDDKQTIEHLEFQKNQYEKYNKAASEMLSKRGSTGKDIGNMQKIMSTMAIDMKTLTDSSPGHIAEMMMQGSTMGIADITKNIKKYQLADKEIIDLADNILKLEEDSFEQWKKYLTLVTQ